MPIPGCVVRRFLRRQSYAQSAWFVNRVQCQGGSADLEIGTDRLRWETCRLEQRTVPATPGHCENRHADARSRRSCGWGSAWTGVLTLGSGVLPLSLLPCEAESSAGRKDSIQYRSESTYRLTRFLQVPRHRSAQFPEGAGSSRPLVSLTSGAGGASSPAMAGVISAGTEAMVAAGFPGWYVCWPAP